MELFGKRWQDFSEISHGEILKLVHQNKVRLKPKRNKNWGTSWKDNLIKSVLSRS
jgi:hypothetical protein